MFDNNYICAPKGIPFVAYFKTLDKKAGEPFTHLHFHSDFEMLYICDGAAEFTVSGNTFVAEKDSLVLINPFETHSAKVKKAPLSYYCMDFDTAMLGLEKGDEIINERLRYGNLVKGGDLFDYIKNACGGYFETPDGWQEAVRGNLLLIFSGLYNTLSSTEQGGSLFVKETLSYIKQNISGPLTSGTAAQALGYDQSYFCRCFKKNFGCKFGEYVNLYRVETAKNLLFTHKVSETVEKCGFSGSSSFCQIFKKITGLSPSEYKKLIKENKNDIQTV